MAVRMFHNSPSMEQRCGGQWLLPPAFTLLSPRITDPVVLIWAQGCLPASWVETCSWPRGYRQRQHVYLPDAGRAVPSNEGCSTNPPYLPSLLAVRQMWRGFSWATWTRATPKGLWRKQIKGSPATSERRAVKAEWTSTQEGNALSCLSHG